MMMPQAQSPDMSALMGALQQGPQGPPSGGGEQESVALLKQAQRAMQQYHSVQPDEEDKLAAAKIVTEIQALLAKDQQDMDKAAGGSFSPRMARNLNG